MNVDYCNFHSRKARIAYIVNRFNSYLHTKVLDVGCDQADLKQFLNGAEYTGIDMSEAADIQLNLERIDRLPFEDNVFNCVICADVLEHLDNLHLMFAELFRVSANYVIIAWPNNWVNARVPIERGIGTFKHYGLPAEKPRDRHKWFFNISEAKAFMHAFLEKHPEIQILEERVTEKPRWFFRRFLRRLRYPGTERYRNRYANTYWTVLKKQ